MKLMSSIISEKGNLKMSEKEIKDCGSFWKEVAEGTKSEIPSRSKKKALDWKAK